MLQQIRILINTSGHTIRKNTLEQPLVAIANYFFDSILQELFRIRNRKVEQTLLGIFSKPTKEKSDPIPSIH